MKKALKKHPKDLKMISDLGKLFLQSKDYDKAIRCFDAVRKKSRTSTHVFYNYATAYRLKGNLDKALEYYNKMIDYNPEHIQSYVDASMIYSYMGNNKEAIRKMRKAYQLNKEDISVVLDYAKTLMRAGEFVDGIEKLDYILL